MNSAMAVSVNPTNLIGAPHSILTDHGECCKLARDWLICTHRSMSFNHSEAIDLIAPHWLKRKFRWGPVQWPISWCEAVRKRDIDCGVFAAFAREIMSGSLYQQASRTSSDHYLIDEHDDNDEIENLQMRFAIYPAQIILDQPKTYTEQWSILWAHVSQNISWIGSSSAYHEVCALADLATGRVRIYDPTEAHWLDPVLERGINNVIGVKVNAPCMLEWGAYLVGQDQWVTL